MATIVSNTLPSVELGDVASLLAGRHIAVLTGAGLSTDSGIPDYRGQGASKRTPMNISDFLGSHRSRQRYWAGAHVGWRTFSAAEPNPGHLSLVAMEQHEIVTGIISQNVDGLHRRAGTAHVVDLHGTLDRVTCLDCDQMFDRSGVERQLATSNPWLSDIAQAVLAPDGDVLVSDYEQLIVPTCTVCGGMLKPDVVFFGEFVPKKIFSSAEAIVKRSDALIVAGSSLAVNSGLRLVEVAKKRKLPIVIINRGPTKGDDKATIKVDGGTSESLAALAQLLGASRLDEDIE